MTHLILHKVRGKPEYDVATKACATDGTEPCQPQCGCWDGERCLVSDEWIIPTSGHRCYPYKTWPLDELGFGNPPIVPQQWPDHYACDDTPVQVKVDMSGLLSRLIPKIRRRI